MFYMFLKNFFNLTNLKFITIIFSSIVIFYMWDFGAKYNLNTSIARPWWNFYGIDKRFLTLLPLIFFLKKDTLLLLNKKFFPILVIWLYIIFQYIFNFFKFDRIFTITDLKYFFAFSVTLLMIYFCKEIILLNKKKITLFLLYLSPLFLISGDISILNKEYLLWKCGLFGNSSPIFKLFFLESSHFGMVAIPAFLLNLFYLCKKFNFFNFLLLIIFSIIMFIFMSTTLVLGTILSIIIILFTNFKKINKKFFLSCVIVLFAYIFLFLNLYGCSRKITDLFYHSYIISLENIMLEKKKTLTENDSQIKIKNDNGILELVKYKIANSIVYSYKKLKVNTKTRVLNDGNVFKTDRKIEIANLTPKERENVFQKINVTTQVAKNSFVVALKTLIIKPFGVGLNRFEDAFKIQIKNQKNFYSSEIMKINRNDGSANLNKLIGEFGFASFIIFAYFLFFIFSKKISIENKLFLFPLILTQTIRGAGYFNGGYLVATILIILIVHDTKEKN
jgi:hypothetical protein